jgi:hypothetical protein
MRLARHVHFGSKSIRDFKLHPSLMGGLEKIGIEGLTDLQERVVRRS